MPIKPEGGKMKKIIVTIWVSLDGFVAGDKNEMDWITSIYDETMAKYETDIVASADTLILGRLTYDSFSGAWPKVPDNPSASQGEIEYARKLNAMRKIVFSKSLKKAEWNNTVLMPEIDASEIQKLKQGSGKDILIYGSASIIQQLTNLGLIDEYQLLVHPVVLGSGKPLFKNIKERVKLKLTGSKTHPSGVVVLTYQPAPKG
jgi:dihydrofolate reductase